MINLLNNINKRLRNAKFLAMLVLLFIFINILPVVVEASEASLFFSPSSGTYQRGSTFSIKVKVNSDGASVNAAQAKILFPSEILEVRSISKVDSILILWPEEPVFSNSKGEISFKGGIPAPGFTGTGNILTINFQARKVGQAKVSFSEAEVLAADGRGTNILKFTPEASFSIIQGYTEVNKAPDSPKISSPTHPQENLWYNNSNPEFAWEISPNIIGINYKFDQNPFSLLKAINKDIESLKRFEKIEDGIWYFHLRIRNKIGWSKTSHYKIQIDTVPPNPFDITVDNQGDPTNPRPFLYFETNDDLSGVSHYDIKIGNKDTFSLVMVETNPFHIPQQEPGTYEVLVKAIDQAGNSQESSAFLNIESIPSPEVLIYPEIYVAGEELFYVSGTAPPDLTVVISFEKDEKLIRSWEVKSNRNGDWSLSTNETFKSGKYSISAKSRDERGAISYPSPKHQIKVVLTGISIGSLTITYRVLFSILVVLIISTTAIVICLILLKVKRIRKETQEATESLKSTFNRIKRKTIEKIEYLDSKPGLNSNEEKLRNELINILEKSEGLIAREIEDIKSELR